MNVSRTVWKLWTFLVVVLSLALSPGASGKKYELGVDSLPQEGVPKGTVEERTWNESTIYPGITHSGWVYVPAQYDAAKPACVMVFLDGADFVLLKGEMRVPTVLDNLIHKDEIPVTIGIFINPGRNDSGESNRTKEYVTLGDTYARFLIEEILPEVGKDYNLVDDAAGRAVCGMSDSGVGTFTVAWERPEGFSKAMCHIGSFVRVPGGAEYPYLIRKTRGNPKPIRVYIQGNENDLNILEGSWTLGNIAMEAALLFARYDYRFEMGKGGHDLDQGGAIFPDALRWIWRDYPGVKGAGDASDLNAVIGQWDVTTNTLGHITHSVLTVTEQDGALSAALTDEKNRQIEVTAISFKDDILSYEFRPPQSEWSKEKASKDKEEWSEEDKRAKSKQSEDKELKDKESMDKDSASTMTTWLKVNGSTFKGALCPAEKSEIDFSVKGRKRDGASAEPMHAPTKMPMAKAESVGMSTEGLRRIDEMMQEHIDAGHIQGGVTIVARRGKVVHFSTHGEMDVEKGRPMEPDAIYLMASSAKPVIAVATLMLVDDGLISLDDPVSKFIPEFADMKVAVWDDSTQG
jgi:enterochelin esterase family protein